MKNIPFVYLIGWSWLDVWYYGVRYAEGCDPSDLWTTYFTSSDHVAVQRWLYGEPDVVKVKRSFSNVKSAKEYESRIIRLFEMVDDPQFLNLSYSDWKFHNMNKETRDKMSMNSPMRGKINGRLSSTGEKIGIVSCDDPRVICGEIVNHLSGYHTYRDVMGNKVFAKMNDPKVISGELVSWNRGSSHSSKTKENLSAIQQERVRLGNHNFVSNHPMRNEETKSNIIGCLNSEKNRKRVSERQKKNNSFVVFLHRIRRYQELFELDWETSSNELYRSGIIPKPYSYKSYQKWVSPECE